MKKLFVAAVMLFNSHFLMAQGIFEEFNSSHFARAMRLGNAYAGVAEGPETMFYNAAGLADVKSYSALASTGQGFAFYVPNVNASDMAVTIPINNTGTAGASINSLSYHFLDDVVYRIYSLSYAHKFFNSLNVGLTANYYHLSLGGQLTIGNPPTTGNGTAFDINLGVLYKLPVRINPKDELRLGVQIKNVLNNELSYDLSPFQEHKLSQNIRAGISYTVIPTQKPIAGFIPFKLMGAFDAIYLGEDYRFTRWQPNYGIEATFVEIFQLSFGRENEKQIKQTYYSSPQHPVNRYGAGLKVPLNRIFDMNFQFDLRIDYCKSDWQMIDEDEGIIPLLGDFPGPRDRIDAQDDAISVGVDVRI